MTSFNAVKRIAKDIKSIINDPIDNVYYQHDETNLLKGYLLIIGNEMTPYSHGYYFFTIDFPEDYPFMPPIVKYLSNDGYTRYNPNLYICGKVCLSIINTWQGEGWTSCQTLRSVIVVLTSIFNDKPLLNEPGIRDNSKMIDKYNLLIEYKTITFLIYEIVKRINSKNDNTFNNKFYMFKDIVNKTFKENYDKIIINLKDLQERCKENNIEKLQIDTYNINTTLNFSLIYKDLEKLYNSLS